MSESTLKLIKSDLDRIEDLISMIPDYDEKKEFLKLRYESLKRSFESVVEMDVILNKR